MQNLQARGPYLYKLPFIYQRKVFQTKFYREKLNTFDTFCTFFFSSDGCPKSTNAPHLLAAWLIGS